MSYEYDEVGNRKKRTDHNGAVTNYVYDNLNRLTSGSMGTYTYDDLSRIETATNAAGTVSFTYDNRGRIETTTDVYGKVIDYDYYPNGNREFMKLNGGSLVGYSYDDANRLESVTNIPESAVTTYDYDDADRLTSKALPNGITTSYAYDDMSRLTRIKEANSTTTFLDRQYSYNTANQIETITYPTRTKTYSYDNVDRLTGVTDSLMGSVENYGYDEVGNRTGSHLSSTYSYDPFNRLTATDSVTYTYDNNGRMTSRTHGGGLFRAPVPPPPGDESKTYYFNYDNDGRLTGTDRATETEYGIELASSEYRYDALGRRIYENNPDVSITQYTYDGDDVIATSDFGGYNLSTRQNGPGIDNKLSIRPAGSSSSTYYHLDQLGTTTGTSNVAGSLTPTAELDSFGNAAGDFTGREHDSFTELYYYRARMYDPQLGRFTSEDPIGFAGGDVNLYGYVRNNPQGYVDPHGTNGKKKYKYPTGGPRAVLPGTNIPYRMDMRQEPYPNMHVWWSSTQETVISHRGGWLLDHGGKPTVPPPSGYRAALRPVACEFLDRVRARTRGGMRGGFFVLGISSGLITDYEIYRDAGRNNTTIEAEMCERYSDAGPYIDTIMGMLPNPYQGCAIS